jgi:hypothetical protein
LDLSEQCGLTIQSLLNPVPVGPAGYGLGRSLATGFVARILTDASAVD